MANQQKIVLLSVCGPEDFFLINRLRAVFPDLYVIRIAEEGPTESKWRAAWRQLRANPLRQIYYWLEQVFYDLHARRLEKTTVKLLAKKDAQAAPVIDSEIAAGAINSPGFVHQLSQLAPDFLVVSGGPILKENIFSIAKRGTINVHHGLAPWYRGGYTLFWPLYYGDFDRIGVTVHLINAGVDTGQLLGYGYCPLQPDSSEASLTISAAELAVELLIPLLQTPGDAPLTGLRQTEKGKLFRYGDRRPWHELKYWWQRHILRQRPPRKDGRIERLLCAAEAL